MKLEVRSVSKRFGGLAALTDVSLTADSGRLTALIGPNGAGKTTMFNCVAGYHRPDGGSVHLDGAEITGLRPSDMVDRGLARTFQLVRGFEGLTVRETVMAAAHWRSGQGFLSSMLRLPSVGRSERRLAEEAAATLEALGIADLADRHTHELPYGQQRLVELAKVLATGARLLLLDEPAAGLHTSEVDALAAVLLGIRSSGRTVLMVEHNMGFVMDLADAVVVLDFGRKLAEGPPAQVRQDPAVIDAYLGKGGEQR